jgi:hypothetical protein
MLEKRYIANIADAIAKEAFRLQPAQEMSVKEMIFVESLEAAKVFFDRLKRQGALETKSNGGRSNLAPIAVPWLPKCTSWLDRV